MTLHDELAGLAAKATPGPWDYTFRKGDDSEGEVLDPDGDFLAIIVGKNYARWRDVVDGGDAEFEANAALIVALRNNLPAILSALNAADEVRRLREEMERLTEQVRRLDNAASLFYQLRTTIMVRFDGLKSADSALWRSINAAFDKLEAARAALAARGLELVKKEPSQ